MTRTLPSPIRDLIRPHLLATCRDICRGGLNTLYDRTIQSFSVRGDLHCRHLRATRRRTRHLNRESRFSVCIELCLKSLDMIQNLINFARARHRISFRNSELLLNMNIQRRNCDTLLNLWLRYGRSNEGDADDATSLSINFIRR
tara:strand:+ start:292 stop:723 length:432 start_codon:yes stop_codon:yes gene_type:complete